MMAFSTDKSARSLLDMLSYQRVRRSKTEEDFIDRFIRPLGAIQDEYGNLWLDVPDERGDPNRILWSCHTDTVHKKEGRQTLTTDHQTGVVTLLGGKVGQCLGADDGAGIWLMTEMISAGVPGRYVFHREEECGGLGSSWVASKGRINLDGIEIAIALDRAGYRDVITHQGFGRCCSDKFANQLASLLGGGFRPDDTGVFTDTANYVDIISECTNLSVGYFSQHGPKESLDVGFLVELRDKLIYTDWSLLEAHRDPSEQDWGYGGKWGDDKPLSEMEEFVADNVGFVADLLKNLGYTLRELETEMYVSFDDGSPFGTHH